MEIVKTWSLGFGDGGDEGNDVAAAEELGEEQDSVALCFWGLDPLQARSQHACVTATLSKYSTTVAAHSDPLRSDIFFPFSFMTKFLHKSNLEERES